MYERNKDNNLSFPWNMTPALKLPDDSSYNEKAFAKINEVLSSPVDEWSNITVMGKKPLNERRKDFILKYYRDNLRYSDIAKEYGISKERVRQELFVGTACLRRIVASSI